MAFKIRSEIVEEIHFKLTDKLRMRMRTTHNSLLRLLPYVMLGTRSPTPMIVLNNYI